MAMTYHAANECSEDDKAEYVGAGSILQGTLQLLLLLHQTGRQLTFINWCLHRGTELAPLLNTMLHIPTFT
jgi:hypothetical protein